MNGKKADLRLEQWMIGGIIAQPFQLKNHRKI